MVEKLIDITERKLCTERLLTKYVNKVFQYFGLYKCIVCSSSLDTLCSHCFNKTLYISPFCWFCNQHTSTGLSHIKCRDSRGWYNHKLYFYQYTKVIKQLYKVYKFKKVFVLQHQIEGLVREYILRDPFLLIKNSFNLKTGNRNFFVPVPMSKRKRIARGFSPAEELAVILAREISSTHNKNHIGLFPTLFLKAQETIAQSKKNRIKRLISIQHAFTIQEESIIFLKNLIDEGENITLWIIDDVHTTGATATILIELLTSALEFIYRKRIEINFLSFAKA